MELLARYEIETKGKHCVVLGRSNIVGKPVATLMMQKAYPGNTTVTVCHSATPNIKEICRTADIIIAALGSPEFVTADMVKEGVVIIDVGTTRVPDATKKIGIQAHRRRKIRRSSSQMLFYHPRSRWSRPYDYRVAHA